MGRLTDIDTRQNMVTIVSKLPFHIQARWRRQVVEQVETTGEYPGMGDLSKLLDRAAREANDPVFGNIITPKEKPRGSSFAAVSATVEEVSQEKKFVCFFCKDEHSITTCQKFRDLPVEKRRDFARDHKLCFNCFSSRHTAGKCGKPKRCNSTECTGKHSYLLHLPAKGNTNVEDADVKKAEVTSTFGATKTVSSCIPRVALPTVPVRVSSHDGRYVETYALLDQGSTNTFCTKDLVDELQIQGKDAILSLNTLDKADSVKKTSYVTLNVADVRGENQTTMHHVFVTDQMPSMKETIATLKDVGKWPHLQGVLHEIPSTGSMKVSLLIGQDVPAALVPLEVKRGRNLNEPYACRSIFGWAMNGPIGGSTQKQVFNNFVKLDELQHQVEKFWKLDSCDNLASEESELSLNDRKCLDIWDSSTVRQDGHYVMKVPFKKLSPDLPNNYQMAENRLKSLKKRLQRDDELKAKYIEEINNMVNEGYAEPVDTEIKGEFGKIWYIPHHNVVNKRKPDKFRVVFDCAAEYEGTSLNDAVLQGPDLTNKLVGVLTRFRHGKIAIMADIKAMFHQVRVASEDRDVLRFLWYDNEDLIGTPKMYRMTSHLFGGVWSPSCANYALQRVADDNKTMYDAEVTDCVKNNFYVDDCLKSCMNVQETVHLIKDLKDMLKKGGFTLTKWTSNNLEVIQSIPVDERAKNLQTLELGVETMGQERALGVQWNTLSDEFSFKIALQEKPETKRGMISVISSIYDPLGLVCPVVLEAKKIFQEECRLKKTWDEPLAPDNTSKWRKWKNEISEIENYRVPRCFIPMDFDKVRRREIHCFADASTNGYGAVAYLRVEDEAGRIHCAFLMGKSRLAPLKPLTVPRLELSAAVLAVKLNELLLRELMIKVDGTVFWTDSMIVLHYIQNEASRYQTFVANRLAIIQDGSLPEQWRHVDTRSNPADYASRGLDAVEMCSNIQWKQGPTFLWRSEREWPERKLHDVQAKDTELKKIKKVQVSTTTLTNDDLIEKLIQQHSDWMKLKRSIAWLLKLKAVLKNKVTADKGNSEVPYLTVTDLRKAEKSILQYVQVKHYGVVMKKSSSIRSLEPWRNNNGLLCVGGRLGKIKEQVILPKNEHATELIVQYHHLVTGHSGREHVLTSIRQRYWIVRPRLAIDKVLKRCITCKRTRGRLCEQRMADLPPDRVTESCAPFTSVGMDCFGPFNVKRGRCTIKRYGCIFTCMATRAIHIEKIDTLDTNSFVNGYLRFESRRGRPTKLRCDNGTNFVGGKKELQKYFCDKEVEWVFNPPSASHMGGVWERQIRTVRKVLQSLVTKSDLTDEDLSTLFCEVENIVNSRPITCVSSDHNDAEPLTPNHLLLLKGGASPPQDIFVQQDIYRKRWRHVQFLADVFWKRWLKEYLPSLQFRRKWLDAKPNLSVGDIVLVQDETVKRREWPLGRVLKVNTGADGLVRSVEVKTQYTTLTRPIHKLCLLEAAIEKYS